MQRKKKIVIRRDSKLIAIPQDLLTDYEDDSSGAHRDFGGVVTRKTSKFIKDHTVIELMFDRVLSCPWDETGVFYSWFRPVKNCTYHVHVDLGKNHDHCGIALGHYSPRGIIIDFAESLNPQDFGGEIDFEDVRNIIQTFDSRRFEFSVTYDSWQSADSIQMLNKMGINANLFSVDTDMKGYLALRRALYQRNIKCYKSDILEKELLGLIKTDKKIDHEARGSKDLADAVASVVWHCETSELRII